MTVHARMHDWNYIRSCCSISRSRRRAKRTLRGMLDYFIIALLSCPENDRGKKIYERVDI